MPLISTCVFVLLSIVWQCAGKVHLIFVNWRKKCIAVVLWCVWWCCCCVFYLINLFIYKGIRVQTSYRNIKGTKLFAGVSMAISLHCESDRIMRECKSARPF